MRKALEEVSSPDQLLQDQGVNSKCQGGPKTILNPSNPKAQLEYTHPRPPDVDLHSISKETPKPEAGEIWVIRHGEAEKVFVFLLTDFQEVFGIWITECLFRDSKESFDPDL